jgi:hypothetical protein
MDTHSIFRGDDLRALHGLLFCNVHSNSTIYVGFLGLVECGGNHFQECMHNRQFLLHLAILLLLLLALCYALTRLNWAKAHYMLELKFFSRKTWELLSNV